MRGRIFPKKGYRYSFSTLAPLYKGGDGIWFYVDNIEIGIQTNMQ
jgi:hypothetical protein